LTRLLTIRLGTLSLLPTSLIGPPRLLGMASARGLQLIGRSQVVEKVHVLEKKVVVVVLLGSDGFVERGHAMHRVRV